MVRENSRLLEIAPGGVDEPASLGRGQVASLGGHSPISLPQRVIDQVIDNLRPGIGEAPLDGRKAMGCGGAYGVVQRPGIAGVPL